MKLFNLTINIGLLCLSIISFFLGIEVFLRVTGLQRVGPNPPLIYQESKHEDISYELKPNIHMRAFKKMVTTNSHGFRGPEIDFSWPRIAVLGDSITFGYSLEDDESIPAYLQELLPHFSIINAGTPGYNLSQQTGVWREKLIPLDPSALVLIFYWNDLNANTAVLHTDGTLRPPNWEPMPETCQPIRRGVLAGIPYACWLDTHSAFYKAVKKVVDGREAMRRQERQREEAKKDPIYDPVFDAHIEEYWAELTELNIYIPDELPRLFVIWPDDNMHSRSRPLITQMAESRGFTVLDLYDEFGNEVETLSYDRIHPSSAATKRAAELIAEQLKEMGL